VLSLASTPAAGTQYEGWHIPPMHGCYGNNSCSGILQLEQNYEVCRTMLASVVSIFFLAKPAALQRFTSQNYDFKFACNVLPVLKIYLRNFGDTTSLAAYKFGGSPKFSEWTLLCKDH
jgi:hypothetical protein